MNQKRHIPSLDGWRAIAILLVIWTHYGASHSTNATLYWSESASRFGVNGVPIFFAISGLLITKLLLEEHDRNGRVELKSFYIRRGFRILPPLFVLLAIIGALGLIQSSLEIASSVFFFRNYVLENNASPYTEHLWSLSVEEHFYLVWPWILVWMLRRGWSCTSMFIFASGLGLSLGLWRALELKLGLIARIAPTLATPMRTDFRLDGIFFGCAAAFILHHEGLRRQAARWLTTPVLLTVIVAAVLVNLVPGVKLASLWFALLVPMALLGTILHPQSFLGAVLESWPARYIGQISYSLYLWQQVFLMPGWHAKPLEQLQQSPWQLIVTFAAAALSFTFVEQPMIATGKRILSGMRAEALTSLKGAERV